MKIESKYDIEDVVYFLHNNAILRARIQGIIFPKYEVIPSHNGNFLKKGHDRSIKYTFFTTTVSQDYYMLRNINDTVVMVEESKIFKTKEELLESL